VAKDSSGITDGELQRLFESWGSESLKKNQTSPTSTGGFQEKFTAFIQEQNLANIVP